MNAPADTLQIPAGNAARARETGDFKPGFTLAAKDGTLAKGFFLTGLNCGFNPVQAMTGRFVIGQHGVVSLAQAKPPIPGWNESYRFGLSYRRA